MKNTIAILFHQNLRRFLVKRYLIYHMAEYWRTQGREVTFLFGTSRFVPADVCIVHVDLSVVPEHYLEFAKRYPMTVNAHISDIRKRTLSSNLVDENSEYGGPVIVKTDLNYAGRPEALSSRTLARLAFNEFTNRYTGSADQVRTQSDYRIFGSISEVPRDIQNDRDLVVEKFLPERREDLYCIRFYRFLGSLEDCAMNTSLSPVVTSFNTIERIPVEVHREIAEYRKTLGIEYGKIDYTIHHGEPVVVDINKTPGVMGGNLSADYLASVHKRAEGINDFLT